MQSNNAPRPVANDAATGTLESALRAALAWAPPHTVRIATAFLSPDGFLALKDGLASARAVKLLLGERPFMNRRGPSDVLAQPGDRDAELRGPSEAIDWYGFLEGAYPWLMLDRAEREALTRERPDLAASAGVDLDVWARVRALVDFLCRDGVEVRRYLGERLGKVEPGKVLDHASPEARLHAKAYLFTGADSRFAAVGSSNLTKAGLENNIELNLLSHDPALVERLEDWFEDRWTRGQDCREEFIKRLEECVFFGRRYTPWQVFIKSLHAAYGRFLRLGLSEDVANVLAGFQQDAVKRCLAMMERHWGAMLCDSVGLGKTWEGMGILAEFAKRRESKVRALIICPAQLEANWSGEQIKNFGIRSETVSMESLPGLVDIDDLPTPFQQAEARRHLRHLQSFDLILVDESHNFRNPETKRYRALMEIIRGGVQDKRVLLLTATPINNSIWDLYFQLMLITRGEDTWYAGRGPITDLHATFKAVEKGEAGAGLLDAMLLSLVRRTRHDIRALAAAGEPPEVGGQPLRFPEHEFPKAVDYSLQNLYGEIYTDVLDAIQHLNFAVYKLESYGVDTGERESEERVKQRTANFVGIMRTILLKRMESSVAAITSTVNTLVTYMDLFLARLDDGKVLTPKQSYRLRAVLGGSLPDAELDPSEWDPKAAESLRELRDAPEDEAQRARLQVDVEADRDRLKGLLKRLRWLAEMWGAKGDPKVEAVRKLLEGLPPRDAHGEPTKVVIFTNYRDTAEHLFKSLGGDVEELKRDFRVPSNLRDRRWMSLLHGGDDRKRRAVVLDHFAPLAALRNGEALDDPILQDRVRPFRAQSIELLIATDVLSEGQNLQDAQYVINYDLHWNPVRMIQRAGRIDRLFSPHERVFIYNVMPEQGLEDLLMLVKSLARKLETIEDAVALDASVLGEQIEAKEFDAIMKIRAGGAAADQVYLEGERAQGLDAGMEVLNQYLEIMRAIATEEVNAIPDGVYSVSEGPRTGVYVMLRMPEELTGEVFWRFYPLDEPTRPLASPVEVLELIRADRERMRHDLPDNTNPFTFLQDPLQAAVDQIGAAYVEVAAAQAPDTFTAKLKRFLVRDDVLKADEELWQGLHEWANQSHPSDALRRRRMLDPVRVLRAMRLDAPLDDLMPQLRGLLEAVRAEGLDRPLARPESRLPTVKDLELVAWELVVGPEGLSTGAAVAASPKS